MTMYRCICCGEEKESEQRCSCPTCGYGMYELPYERGDLLKSEITRFIRCVISPHIVLEDIEFVGKAKDDMRFPDYSRICGYVFAAEKTEVFIKRLKDTAHELKKHYHEDFRKKYTADLEHVKTVSDLSAVQLTEIMQIFDLDMQFDELELPKITLIHSESPNDTLLGIVDDISDKLYALSEKMHKFIVFNNAYSVYRKRPNIDNEKPEFIGAAELRSACSMLDNVIGKKYVVDILDDGSQQLGEMLKAYWTAASIVMRAPLVRKEDIYSLGNGEWMPCEIFLPRLSELMSERFSAVKEIISSPDFLSDKNEDGLFVIYNKMLELDRYRYLDVPRGSFIVGENEKKLEQLIGLSSVKANVLKIKAFAAANKDRKDLNLHMCFYGNPGTGKTEVARIIAGILHENGILPTAKVVETDRSGLVAGYVGQTPMKTRERIEEAMGGVLFIDEAYSLIPKDSPGDYGYEAIAELIKAMEDERGKFCVIFAGYRNPMEQLLSSNQGFRSRIQFTIDFPNYDRDELRKIAQLMLKNSGYTIAENAMQKLLDITDIKRKSPDFANAREVRNILDQVIMCQSVRCVGTDDRELALTDVNTYIKDAKINLPTTGESYAQKIMTAEDELEALVGLTAVKRMVRKIRAYAKRNKDSADFNLHMCFYGNPGTGKTEVARIVSRLLYDAGVLPEAKLVETDPHGLISRFAGDTAQKTGDKVNESMGGVLFVDEAYALAGNETGDISASYGDEAISVLIKEMEDKRGQFCVILAGYKDEMKSMLSSNPGFESRIQFTLDFPDYTREELGEIALKMLHKKHYGIEDSALNLLLDICEYYRARPNFANARTLRNLLDQVIMNQNLRADEEESDDNSIILSDVEEYVEDEGIELGKSGGEKRIGFR